MLYVLYVLGRVGQRRWSRSYLDFLLVERHALDDVETRRFVGFWVGIVRGLEDDFVFGTAKSHARGSVACSWFREEQLVFGSATYAVLFLLPLGWRSEELLMKDDSMSPPSCDPSG